MKTIEQLTYNGQTLSVLITVEKGKGTAEYFINGDDVTGANMLPVYKSLMDSLFENYCKLRNLNK